MSLPTFIIAGAAKCGTSSIYEYMRQHPNVHMSKIKETNFFACGDEYIERNWSHLKYPIKDINTYKSMFERTSDKIAYGEASPIYFESPTAPENIKQLIPDVKIIISLRNPVARAISGFLMHVRHDVHSVNFSEFDFNARYVTGGYYANKIERFFSVLGEKNVKICIFEKLKEDPVYFMQDIYEFIGVDSTFVTDTSRIHNQASVPRSAILNKFFNSRFLNEILSPSIPKSIRQIGKRFLQFNTKKPPAPPKTLLEDLKKNYKNDIEKIERLTKMNLMHWKN